MLTIALSISWLAVAGVIAIVTSDYRTDSK